MEKIKETLKALIVMAERGTKNESRIAGKKISLLLEKHDLALDDISDEEKRIHWYSYRTKFEKRLLHQISYMVTARDDGYYQAKGKTKVGYEMTKLEAVEVDRFYDHWRGKLSEELDVCCEAFIQANMIFPDIDLDRDLDDNEASIPDIENIRRVLRMADTMKGSTPGWGEPGDKRSIVELVQQEGHLPALTPGRAGNDNFIDGETEEV